MNDYPLTPNPDLAVGADNKQGWNQPERRREGFHNLHLRARRALMVRARNVLTLTDAPSAVTAARVRASGLLGVPGFSALVVAEGLSIVEPPVGVLPPERLAWLLAPPGAVFVPSAGPGAWLLDVMPRAEQAARPGRGGGF